MMIDAEELEPNAVVRSDVAVVGAGPAGIVVALELARAGHDVVLVESGRTRYSEAAQRLNDTPHLDPRLHAPMGEATRRQVGGASVIWGGRCVPFDPVDFDDRPYIPHSRWPVGYDEIAAYHARACRWFFCGEPVFSAHDVPTIAQKSIVPGLPDEDVRSSDLERWSLPTDFGKEYGRELRSSARLRLIQGLTCTEVESAEDGRRVAGLVGRTLGGKRIRVEARATVLACGGLGTTRLLLASDRRHPGGIGNHSDLLGRYYMGHISGILARVRFTTPPELTAYGFDRDGEGVYLRRRFSFSRRFLHAERLPNIVGFLVNPDIWDPSHGSGILSFAYLALTSPTFGRYFAPEAIRKSATGDLPHRVVGPHVANMARDAFGTLRFVAEFGVRRFLLWRRVPGFFVQSRSNVYPLRYHGEHVPSRESRITLAEDRDELGMRRLAIDFRYAPQDVDGVLRAHRHWDAHLRKHGRGVLEYLPGDPERRVWDQAQDGFHQAGTTRMSERPEDGVVGPHCNVHGFDDLFVAGSSIFVTSGQANSTFLAIAFALRLADRLRAALPGRRNA